MFIQLTNYITKETIYVNLDLISAYEWSSDRTLIFMSGGVGPIQVSQTPTDIQWEIDWQFRKNEPQEVATSEADAVPISKPSLPDEFDVFAEDPPPATKVVVSDTACPSCGKTDLNCPDCDPFYDPTRPARVKSSEVKP